MPSHASRHSRHPRAIELRARARRMRFAPTQSEWVAWEMLRRRGCGVLFRRQQIVGERIVDFLAPAIRLAVEVDGGYHQCTRVGDKRRDRELMLAGYRVLHLPAQLVLEQPLVARQQVVEAVAALRGGHE